MYQTSLSFSRHPPPPPPHTHFHRTLLHLLQATASFHQSSLLSGVEAGTYHYGSVYCHFYNCTFKPDVLDFEHATAVAAFNDTLLLQGWGILDVQAGYGLKPTRQAVTSSLKDGDTVYGAGYAEGILTAHQINNQMTNFFKIWLSGESAVATRKKLREWLQAQDQWTTQKILENVGDTFWRHVNYLIQWERGLYEGYKTAAKKDPSLPARDLFEFRLLQASGSVGDLIKVVDRTQRTDWSSLKAGEILASMFDNSRCSALIKLLPGFEEIFIGHSTWFRYESTARIFKNYDMNLEGTVNRKISFSSYGGNLQSLDDFYLVGGNLAMLQTSNNIFNEKTLRPGQASVAAHLAESPGSQLAGSRRTGVDRAVLPTQLRYLQQPVHGPRPPPSSNPAASWKKHALGGGGDTRPCRVT